MRFVFYFLSQLNSSCIQFLSPTGVPPGPAPKLLQTEFPIAREKKAQCEHKVICQFEFHPIPTIPLCIHQEAGFPFARLRDNMALNATDDRCYPAGNGLVQNNSMIHSQNQ